MKTKKFEAKTEQEALEKVRDELGLSAIVLSIKKKSGRGLISMFKKPTIVVTAAYDEQESEKDKVLAAAVEAAQAARQNALDLPDTLMGSDDFLVTGEFGDSFPSDFVPPKFITNDDLSSQPNSQHVPLNQQKASAEDDRDMQIVHQLQTIQQLEKMVSMLKDREESVPAAGNVEPIYKNEMVQMFFDSLVKEGVAPEIASKILETAIDKDGSAKQDINLLVKMVYNRIIEILGEPRILVGQETGAGYKGATQVVVFMGPTGVGKTTTIAKLSSILLLQHHKQVGLITADTYRIAAVDQLKTYADIMGLNLKVIYNSDEIISNVSRLKDTHDVILVDTAGRSHKNQENILELKNMLDLIPGSVKYLVLSVTTKQEDMLSIIRAYEAITDFELIFTKLDEAGSLGVLLNVCYLTDKRVSYVSFGQNVPEDIEKIQPDKIAKSLMGTGLGGTAWGEA